MNRIWNALIATPLLVFATGSSAALITFDFTGGGVARPRLEFEEQGFNIGVIGFTGGVRADRVTHNDFGLGVLGNVADAQRGLDSIGANETLVFNILAPTFDRYSSISLHSIGLSNFNNVNEEFDLIIDGARPPILDEFSPSDPNWDSVRDEWLASDDLTAAQRAISRAVAVGADGPNAPSPNFNDVFRIASVTFHAVEVAEPSTLLLTALGFGLVGAAGFRRR